MGSPSPRSRYLDEGKAGKYLFLYHACSVNAPIHVFALFLPISNVRLHIVDPATRRQPIARLREVYNDLRQQQHGKHAGSISINYPESRDFSLAYHSTDSAALKAISRELGLLENQSFTLIISSMKDHAYFNRSVPRLARFPVLSMSKAKAPHNLDVFPWQTNVAQKMCQRYLSLGSWVDRMTALAEYYGVPIGHIDGDQPLLLSDVVFARRLVSQDMVLWWSPSGRPDLGGLEDDTRLTEELPNTEFITPGCYSNVCLEVTVRNLSVNSVLHAMAVNELEGSGGMTAFDSVSHTIEEFADGEVQRNLTLGESNVSPQTFGIVKSIVKAWLLDKIRYGFESPATLAIDHFWRWISSKASHMYDPSIHRFIHSLMRKTFIQLLAEFKRLGSQVIYADFSRLLLVTSKPPGTAHAYATYITTAVTSNELFQHIYLNTERFYDFLLFMDQANAGGIVCEDPLSVDPPEELVVEMRWNIEHFLPPAIQGEFADLLRYFLLEMYKAAQKEGQRAPLRVLANGAPDLTQQDANKVRERDAVRDFISRRLTRKLFRAIENVQSRVRAAIGDPEAERALSFPLLPGSHLNLTDPAVEVTKFACAVFALASSFGNEVGLLTRNALELVGVKAFGQEGAFRNPCAPLRLMGVPCRHCDALRDFDFCRDTDLLPRPGTGEGPRPPRWACTRCGAEHDRTAVEFELIERAHALERAAAQQDLRCARCAQVRADHVARIHDCGGSYNNTVNRTDIRRILRTMVNVAIVHDLNRLRVG
jgi:DNA polymerase epsilon subunit 1